VNKVDDVKNGCYEQLERVFDKCPKYHTNILLRDFNARVGREDIFKTTIKNEVYTKLVMIVELEQYTLKHLKASESKVSGWENPPSDWLYSSRQAKAFEYA
jgi:hypothetical protein